MKKIKGTTHKYVGTTKPNNTKNDLSTAEGVKKEYQAIQKMKEEIFRKKGGKHEIK